MAVTHKIAEICIWGTDSLTHATGKVLSFEKKDTCKPVEITDENGELGSLVLTDRRTEITVEILTKATATLPTAPGTISIGGATYHVRDSEIIWTAGQARKFRVSAWLHAAFP